MKSSSSSVNSQNEEVGETAKRQLKLNLESGHIDKVCLGLEKKWLKVRCSCLPNGFE
ncbi:unnamed protein product [Orchesella dallaii]|uniref:Uncharacterized protein n=1 Tax=Orchesella dallaii TaxID=48710 RepID=A0ABP1QTU7_9HEXA